MYQSVCGSQEESVINGRPRPRYVSVDFPSPPEAEYLSSASYIKETFKVMHSCAQSVTGGGVFSGQRLAHQIREWYSMKRASRRPLSKRISARRRSFFPLISVLIVILSPYQRAHNISGLCTGGAPSGNGNSIYNKENYKNS